MTNESPPTTGQVQPADQVQKGRNVIRQTAEEALTGRGITGATVSCTSNGGDKPGATLTVSLNGRVETQTFSYDEIEDSGEAIDAPAAAKVRMLVSVFIR